MREYAKVYSTILTARNLPHVYIDAFAGPGFHFSKTSKEFVQGSPLNGLFVVPPFKEFFFIDIESQHTDLLKQIVGSREDVHIYQGDANEILLNEVFPQVRYDQFRRGLCLLDPYGLQLRWEVLKRAGELKTIEIFLNFPIMAMNRNSLWRNPESVEASDIERMNVFWGDDSWRTIAYTMQPTLFEDQQVKQENLVIVNAFCDRLHKVAGFECVAKPLPMRNTQGATVYYLLFASQKQVAEKIAEDIVDGIFKKYQGRGKQ